MGQIPITSSFNLPNGQEVIIETGKLATQANGSVVVRVGNTMLFASVVSSKKPKAGQSFFPLSVDYQEKFAAAGRIPGNFFKREARLSDYEILTSRLVDRAIRPLFPDGYMNETQVIINLISAEEDVLPDAYAALAASAALAVSNIPFQESLSEVRVAKIDGTYQVNPGKAALSNSTLDIIVAATMENVMMVEGEMQECQEEELIEAIKIGHDAIKTQIEAQLDLAKKVGDKALIKREYIPHVINEDVIAIVTDAAKDKIYGVAKGALSKFDRKDQFAAIEDELMTTLAERGDEWMEEHGSDAKLAYGKLKKDVIRRMVLDEGVRLDGRPLDQVRNIWTEIGYLPSPHGSAIFTRGETQCLTTLTLGTKLDEQMIDTALAHYFDKFILHYNFPALSVGEIKPMRGPGRREVGHAMLAKRSLMQVLPDDNAYTIRLVADVLESNGSSSMATVCSGSMALMDGGIKIKAPVSGIAMGMISDGEKIAVLSDILGDEDALGDMDFKVTGTENGITGCQMDIKIDGLPYATLEKALEQAKAGRIHILNEMAKTIAAPATDLKDHAPRIVEMRIDKSFIGAVIGSGGKVIQELQEVTNTTITIEEVGQEGVVKISSTNKSNIDSAVAKIEQITHVPEVGNVYDAKVASVMPYGVFVDFSGQSGLLHVSEISHERITDVSTVFKEGDEVQVKLIGIDPKTKKFRLSRKVLLDRPKREDKRD